MKRKNRRIVGLLVGGAILACATVLTVYGLRDSLVFFMTPTEVLAQKPDRVIRIGGMVVDGSVQHSPDAVVEFRITDFEMTVSLYYQGVLPDLFREGQGVVAQGIYNGDTDVFVAQEILAKHDENYMPAEVKDMLENKSYVE